MDVIPKTKGKKVSKVTKSKQELAIKNLEPNTDPINGNKKRKHTETEDENVAQLPNKKPKRNLRANFTNADENNDQNPNISDVLNKVTNTKRIKKKPEIKALPKIDTVGENEEDKQDSIKKNINTDKLRKKGKNSDILSIKKNNEISSDPIPPTVVNPFPKKSRKKGKQCDINNTVPQNGEISNNVKSMHEPYEIPNSKTDIPEGIVDSSISSNIHINGHQRNQIKLSNVSSNIDINGHQKHEIDIEENFFKDMKTNIPPPLYNTVINNDREIKREVNVIDIKNEGGEENLEKVVTISIRDTEGVNTNKDEDELLKQLERKLKPKIPKEGINWPQADLKELLKRMEVSIPSNDSRPFGKRLEEMEWDNIIFKSYTIEECRNMWLQLQKKVRKYRILNEVLQDAKSWVENYTCKVKSNSINKTKVITIKKKGRPQKHPDMPRKPLTAYFIFYLENRDSFLAEHPGVDAAEVTKALGQKFQNLSPLEKKKYEEISLQKKEEYNKKIEEFYETHPEVPRVIKDSKPKSVKVSKPLKDISSKSLKEKSSPKPAKISKPPKQKVPVKPHPPFHYFYVSELEKENVDDKTKFREICKERWKQLPERNKLVWIHYAEAEIAKYEEELEEYVRQHPDYVKNPLKPVLSKEDMQIKDRAAGKPIKPPGSAYNLFARKLLQSDEIKKVPVRDRLIFVSNQWKYCNEDEKNYYKEMYMEERKKYKEQYNAYLERLPEDERKEELKKMAPRMIKTENEKKVIKKTKKKKTLLTKTEKTVEVKPVESEIKDHLTEKLKEPQQPPISPFKYFCLMYSGNEPVALAWKALPKQQKKTYEEELMQKKKDYIRDFEKFLKSLTEEELEAFSKSRRKAKEEKQENEEDEESDSYDSDESSEEEKDEKQEDS